MGEMGTISEHELRERLWASGNGVNTVSLGTLADDALRQARRRQRATRTAATLSVALVVAAVGVTVGTLGADSQRPTSTAVAQHAPVKLVMPIRFLIVTDPTGACGASGIAVLRPCYQVDSAHSMSVNEVADIKAMPIPTSSGVQLSNQWEVKVTFLDSDKDAFTRLTAAAVNRQLAVVIGGRVMTAPRIEETLTTGTFAIVGFSQQFAEKLVEQVTGR